MCFLGRHRGLGGPSEGQHPGGRLDPQDRAPRGPRTDCFQRRGASSTALHQVCRCSRFLEPGRKPAHPVKCIHTQPRYCFNMGCVRPTCKNAGRHAGLAVRDAKTLRPMFAVGCPRCKNFSGDVCGWLPEMQQLRSACTIARGSTWVVVCGSTW